MKILDLLKLTEQEKIKVVKMVKILDLIKYGVIRIEYGSFLPFCSYSKDKETGREVRSTNRIHLGSFGCKVRCKYFISEKKEGVYHSYICSRASLNENNT